MKQHLLLVSVLVAAVLPAATTWDMLVWGNRSPDMNAASSWNDADGNVSTVAPSSNTVLFFTTNAVVQPVLTSSMTVIGLHFHACTNSTSADVPKVHPADGEGGYNYSGYRITGVPGAVLTLDGNSDNKGWTRDLQMASKGTNSIAVPVVLRTIESMSATLLADGSSSKSQLRRTPRKSLLLGVRPTAVSYLRRKIRILGRSRLISAAMSQLPTRVRLSSFQSSIRDAGRGVIMSTALKVRRPAT